MTTTFEEKTEILRRKFFSLFSQIDVNDIADSFILLAISFSCITKDEMKQMIKRIKVNKVLNILNILNKALQIDLTELTLVLTYLFNACVIYKYRSKQFKKAQTIVICKSKKSNYINLRA